MSKAFGWACEETLRAYRQWKMGGTPIWLLHVADAVQTSLNDGKCLMIVPERAVCQPGECV